MEHILNAGTGAGLLVFLVFLFKKNKQLEDFYFLGWIVALVLQLVFYQITLYHFPLRGFFAIVGFAIPLLSSPLLFFYIRTLVGLRTSLLFRLLHFSPFLVYILLLLYIQYQLQGDIITLSAHLVAPKYHAVFNNYHAVPMAISPILYGIWNLRIVQQYQNRISTYFSYDEKIQLKWVQYVVALFTALVIFGFILVFGAIHFNAFSLVNAFSIMGILLSLLLVVFGFYGFHQPHIFEHTKRQPENLYWKVTKRASTYSKSGLTPEKIAVSAQRIEDVLVQQKVFLEEDLTLSSLAKQCDLSPTQLSQVINQHFKLSFYDLINTYRIEEAKKRLSSKDYDHLSLLGIAFECGFKSKSSFNRYFKKYTGSTPSAFKKTSE